MSLVVKLIIGEWLTTFAMFGLSALHKSGNLLKIRKRIAWWLETSSPAVDSTLEQSPQPERENVA